MTEDAVDRAIERMWTRLYPDSGECFDPIVGVAMVTNEVLQLRQAVEDYERWRNRLRVIENGELFIQTPA